MTAPQILTILGSILFVLGGLATFVIAYRRGPSSWEEQLDKDARKADRSRIPAVFARPKAAEAVIDEAPSVDETSTAAGAVVVEEQPIAATRKVVELSASDQGVNRRQFFNRALAATFFGTLGTFGVASLAFFWPKVSGGFGSDVSAGPVQAIKDAIANPDGTITPFYLPAAKAWIVPMDDAALAGSQFAEDMTVADGLAALWQKCVHLGCAVPWCQSSQGFECPCHGSKYNAAGEYEAGPAPRNLDRFALEVIAGRLIINTGQVRDTPRASFKTVPYPQGLSCL